MKTKAIQLFFLLLTYTSVVSSQIARSSVYVPSSKISVNDLTAYDRSNRQMYELLAKKKNLKNLNIEGSPYLEKSFHKGNILFKGKKTNTLYLLRYNANKDYIEILGDGKEFNKVLENPNISCIIGKDNYIFTTYLDKKTKEPESGYLKEIYTTDNFTLYKKSKKIYFPEKTSVDPLVPSHPAKYKLFTYLYVKNNKTAKPATYLKNRKALKKFLRNEGIQIDKKELKKIQKLL